MIRTTVWSDEPKPCAPEIKVTPGGSWLITIPVAEPKLGSTTRTLDQYHVGYSILLTKEDIANWPHAYEVTDGQGT